MRKLALLLAAVLLASPAHASLKAIAAGTTGTVTSVQCGTGLSGGTITTAGVCAVIYGATSGTSAQGNDTRFPANVTGLRKGAGAGSADTAATAGTDYVIPAGNVATATALAANPTDCSANQYAIAIDVGGNLTCGAISSGQVSGLGTMATQNANAVAITGGAINGTTVGATTRAAGNFTAVGIGAASTANLSVAQSGTGAALGFQLTGTAIDASNTGTGTLMSAGHNSAGNKQVWVLDPDFAGLTTGIAVRFYFNGSAVPILDGIRTDGGLVKKIQIGQAAQAGSGVSLAIVTFLAGTATAGTAPAQFTAGVLLTSPVSGSMETDASNNLYYTPASTRFPVGLVLSGTTGSIGGGALLAGACATGTVTVTGATTSMAAVASPAAGVDPSNGGVLGVAIDARVSSANTVTVSVCSPIAGTPTAATYAVRVFI